MMSQAASFPPDISCLRWMMLTIATIHITRTRTPRSQRNHGISQSFLSAPNDDAVERYALAGRPRSCLPRDSLQAADCLLSDRPSALEMSPHGEASAEIQRQHSPPQQLLLAERPPVGGAKLLPAVGG